jgi:hypothetical protein
VPTDSQSTNARAAEAFAACGISTDMTCAQAIGRFYEKTGYSADYTRRRGEFHEICHVAACATEGLKKDEAPAAIFEMVLMRGVFRQRNIADKSITPAPGFTAPPVPSLDESYGLAHRAVAETLASSLVGHYLKTLQMPFIMQKYLSREDAAQIHQQAIRQDELLRAATGGRPLYMLSTAELEALPAAFLGVTWDEGAKRFRPLPEPARQRVLETLRTPSPSPSPATPVPETA